MLKFRIYDKDLGAYLDDKPHRRPGWGVTQAVTTDGTVMEFWFTGSMSDPIPQMAVLPGNRYEVRILP